MPSQNRVTAQWPMYVGWSTRLNCRGVLALRSIKKNDLVESCPLILIKHPSQAKRLAGCPTGNLLDNYYYDWTKKFWCLPLGYAVVYNHSYHPNLKYVRDYKNQLLNYIAIKNISKDEELTVNYNGDPLDQTPIDSWFNEAAGRPII